jgi:phage terminase small subunit
MSNAISREMRAAVATSDLPEKQKAFCLYYVQSHNAAQSYVKAYGCTMKTATVNGLKLLKDARVKKEIRALRRLLEARFDVDKLDLIRFCLKVIGADIGDYCEFRPQEISVTDKDGNTTQATVNSVIVKNSLYCDTSLIKTLRQKGPAVDIELYSKEWAWGVLERLLGWGEREAVLDSSSSGMIRLVESLEKARAERDKEKNN